MICFEEKQLLMVFDICRTKSYFEMVTNAACQFDSTDLLSLRLYYHHRATSTKAILLRAPVILGLEMNHLFKALHQIIALAETGPFALLSLLAQYNHSCTLILIR